MVSSLISRLVVLVFGTMYPAYASYKAVKTKNTKEYVKWMMYWIVFAFFTCIETFTDVFVSWFPFYFEIKILFVLWLLSPHTKGASLLYRKFVHPQLNKHENEIDTYISAATEQGYSALVRMGSQTISMASNMVLSTAMKGQLKLSDHLRKSYSVGNLNEAEELDKNDLDDETDNRQMEEDYKKESNSTVKNNAKRSSLQEIDYEEKERSSNEEEDVGHVETKNQVSKPKLKPATKSKIVPAAKLVPAKTIKKS